METHPRTVDVRKKEFVDIANVDLCTLLESEDSRGCLSGVILNGSDGAKEGEEGFAALHPAPGTALLF